MPPEFCFAARARLMAESAVGPFDAAIPAQVVVRSVTVCFPIRNLVCFVVVTERSIKV